MNIKTHTFKIEGLSPLLTHNPASMVPSGNGEIKHKKIPTAEEEAKKGLYMNADGTYYLPSIAFRNALIYAVGGKKVGKRSARAIVSAGVFNADHATTLLDDKDKPLKKYAIDTRSVLIMKARILRSRPMFEPWHAQVKLDIDLDLLDPKVIEENLNEAGTICGVGDYRPQKTGPFGRFTAKLIK